MNGLQVEEIVVAHVHADTEVQTRVASIDKGYILFKILGGRGVIRLMGKKQK